MPSFHEHISQAFGASVIGGLVTFILIYDTGDYGLISAFTIGVTGMAVVLVGAMLPDIDHHASIPRRWLGTIGGLAAMLGWVLGTTYISAFMATYFDSFLVGGIVVAVVTYLGLTVLSPLFGLIGTMFNEALTHRGFTHSGLFVVLAIVGAYFFTDQIISIIGMDFGEMNVPVVFGILLGIGILLHITADGKSIAEMLG